MYVCAFARARWYERSPRISMEINILPYLNRNVELLNIRRRVSRFCAEYYPVHYVLVCVYIHINTYARETLIILQGIVFKLSRSLCKNMMLENSSRMTELGLDRLDP